MQLNRRINLKVFIPVSLVLTAVFCFFTQNTAELFVVLGVYIATLLNLWMLMYVLTGLVNSQMSNSAEKPDKFIIALFFIGKLVVLLGSLSLGVHFIGNKIIIPVLNYVLQIFALGISMQKSLKDQSR